MASYAVSDLHGQYGHYEKMLEVLDLRPGDTLYCLGDVVDRGPDGVRILKDMLTRPYIVPFLGNHEMLMRDGLLEEAGIAEKAFYGQALEIWRKPNNGGRITHHHYLSEEPPVQNQILDYLCHMWVQRIVRIRGTSFFLCHSYMVPGKGDVRADDQDLTPQELFDALWRSPFRTDRLYEPVESYRDDHIHVIGHVPIQYMGLHHAFQDENVLNIDGGLAMLGIAALEHDDDGGPLSVHIDAGRGALCILSLDAVADGVALPDACIYVR